MENYGRAGNGTEFGQKDKKKDPLGKRLLYYRKYWFFVFLENGVLKGTFESDT